MDPILSLALSMQSNPGVYALLLGSGISRAAKIPTGWEVVVDLIGRVAAMKKAEVAGDPASWYEREFKEEPSYSRLLGRVARQRDERQRLLKAYFEPTEEERQQGSKEPTAAHRAIASLCRRGYIRVIVTTNFDRLLEQALSSEGLQPTVISTPDAVKGAPPLVHAGLVIVKIHGDYLDTRLRNTTGELEAYPAPLTRLLDRIFDEFGLLVCGWSARWDPALRKALERCRNQRYTTYWTGLEEPDADLNNLLRLRRAEFIQTDGADELFIDLDEKILALEEHARPHPLSVEAAVATMKRYLPDPVHQIRYHDLLLRETERVNRQVMVAHSSVQERFNEQAAVARVEAYEAITEILRALFATASFWGQERHELALTKSIEQLAAQQTQGGMTFWLNLRYYPALLLLYAGGIAAVANDNYSVLRALLIDPQVNRDSTMQSSALALTKDQVLEDSHAQILPAMQNKIVALSQWLDLRLRESLRPVLISGDHYQLAFDRFEYLWGLIHVDSGPSPLGHPWGPIGNFVWRRSQGSSPADQVAREIDAKGAEWGPLRYGFFRGDVERLKDAKAAFDQSWHGGRLR